MTTFWQETLIHLLALAARLEGEGQYNIAKLARAAADALGRQAAWGLKTRLRGHVVYGRMAISGNEVVREKVSAMIPTMTSDVVPLRTDVDGAIRVGRTRVTLDTVVSAFLDGATAEEIAFQYPSLDLADIYAVISYYLRRRVEVESYLQRRQRHAETIRKQNETRFDPTGVRERLLARRASESA